jgi:hypothetical protein
MRIRSFALDESLKLQDTGKQRVALFGDAGGVQITQSRLSAPLSGAALAPTKILRSHVGA